MPSPLLLMSIVAVVVSFVLILESQNAEQQHEQVKHFAAMMTETRATAKRTTAEADDNENGREKRTMTTYDHEHAKRCIQQDNLVLSPIFNHHKFQWIFHFS